VQNAFVTASNLASLSTGVALATTPGGNGTVPQTEINTLANVLARCINSTGPAFASCATLFSDAKSGGTSGTTPTDTATAAINMAHNPASNLAALYALSIVAPLFTPALNAHPNDFTIALNYSGGGLGSDLGIAVDGSGNVWVANFHSNTVSELNNAGTPISSSTGYTGGRLQGPLAIAIDISGNAWVANDEGTNITELNNAGANVSGPGTVSGSTLTITGVGTVVIAANQAGNTNYAAATQVTETIAVNIGNTLIGLTATASPVFLQNPVTLTATLSSPGGTPVGSVLFLDGSNPIGTAILSRGIATLSVSSLTLGTHSITAQYSGAGSFAAANSSAVSETVQDFSLNINGTTAQTIQHGGEATFSMTVNPIGGSTMPSAISFTVTGAPDMSTISFTPQTITAGSGSTNVTLTIQTPDYPVGPWTGISGPKATLALLALGCLLLPFGRRRSIFGTRVRLISCVILLLAVSSGLVTLTGCGSGWGPQQYTITVTGTSGQLPHSTTVTLTSQ
jgi:hypothetical protein